MFVYAVHIHSLRHCLCFQETSLKIATYFHMLVVSLVFLSFCILYCLKISKSCAYKYQIYFFMPQIWDYLWYTSLRLLSIFLIYWFIQLLLFFCGCYLLRLGVIHSTLVYVATICLWFVIQFLICFMLLLFVVCWDYCCSCLYFIGCL